MAITTQTEFAETSAVYPSLRGKRIFITGGGAGIGASLVEGFARQGAQVAFVDIAEQESAALVAKLAAKNLSAPWYQRCDVTDIKQLQQLIRDAATTLGDFH